MGYLAPYTAGELCNFAFTYQTEQFRQNVTHIVNRVYDDVLRRAKSGYYCSATDITTGRYTDCEIGIAIQELTCIFPEPIIVDMPLIECTKKITVTWECGKIGIPMMLPSKTTSLCGMMDGIKGLSSRPESLTGMMNNIKALSSKTELLCGMMDTMNMLPSETESLCCNINTLLSNTESLCGNIKTLLSKAELKRA